MITPIFQERRLRQRDVRLLDQGHTFVSGREGLIDLRPCPLPLHSTASAVRGNAA